MKQINDDKLLNMSESAKYLGLHRNKLYRMIDKNEIQKPLKVAGHSVYSLTYLRQFRSLHS